MPLQLCQPRAAVKTEVLWDTYGVPHVFAGNTADMYYGFGWAQMHNHANLLLQLYGQARGRGAEYWGEEQLPLDKLIHLFNIPELAKQQYAQQQCGCQSLYRRVCKRRERLCCATSEGNCRPS